MKSDTKEKEQPPPGWEWGADVPAGERVALVLNQPLPGALVRWAVHPSSSDQFGWFPISIKPHDMRLEFTWNGRGGEPPDTIRFVANLDDGWRMSFDVALRDDEVRVTDGPNFRPPDDGSAAMSSRYLRTITPGIVYEAADHWLRDPWVTAWLGPRWHRFTDVRPGRRGRDDAFYAEWAARYVTALIDHPRNPAAVLRQQHQERTGVHTTAAQVSAYLNRARNRGLLTQAPPGRAGGRLTQKAAAVLERARLHRLLPRSQED